MKIISDGSPCVINALKIMEVTIKNFPDVGITAEAVYALAHGEEKTNKLLSTHGRCTAITTNWSKQTMELLTDLINSMEEDLIPRHFNTNTAEENLDAKRTTDRRPEEVDQI